MHLRLYLLSFAVGCSLESHPCVVAAKRKEAVKTERRHDILQLSPECKRGNGDSCNALGDIYAQNGEGARWSLSPNTSTTVPARTETVKAAIKSVLGAAAVSWVIPIRASWQGV
jgi:hypothetical protein